MAGTMKRHCLALCFSLAVASCASFQLGGQSTAGPVMQEGDVVAAESARTRVGDQRHACPSPDFRKFLHAFSGRADVQRKFTRLPLEYGQLDTAAIGTEKEYSLRTIKEFEKIPSFDVQGGGIIIPDERHRTNNHERLAVQPKKGEPEDPEYPGERKVREDMIAILLIDGTGFHIYYRFQWTEGCWFLRAIHDKST
jgi:hypothetical protein